MSEYFREDEKLTIDQYIYRLNLRIIDGNNYNDAIEDRISILKDAKKYVGNVIMSEYGFDVLVEYYTSEHKYDVNYDEELLQIVGFINRFPMLSNKALQTLLYRYTEDIFESFEILNWLEDQIQRMGKLDLVFSYFIKELDKLENAYDNMYKEQAYRLDKYTQYSKAYIDYIKNRMIKTHTDVECYIDALPDPEVIEDDERLFMYIKENITTSIKTPLSYVVTDLYARGMQDTIDDIRYEKEDGYINALFTKEAFEKKTKTIVR